MAGGKGKIEPSDGKQFSSKYQPDKEIWKEKTAVKFCQDMIDWLNEKDEDGEDRGNIFFEEFIYMIANPLDYHRKASIYVGLPSYLANKFSSCSKLIEKAKKIQEIKLYKYGAGDRLNASLTKFVLINEHGKINEKQVKTDITTGGENIKPTVINLGTGTPPNDDPRYKNETY